MTSKSEREPADEADRFIFEGEKAEVAAAGETPPPWKVLIVDDEPDVHVATKIVLKNFAFQGRGIEIIDAYSGNEACEKLRQHPDTAVAFLDVVMETEDAGLRVVKRIRDEIGNPAVRIVLRTGQPGLAPESDVVLNYHINDYKAKTELTGPKLLSTLLVNLRAYQELRTIESNRHVLATLVDAASNMDLRARGALVMGILMQLASLLKIGGNDLILLRRGEGAGQDTILAAGDQYVSFVGKRTGEVLDAESASAIATVFATGAPHVDGSQSIYPVRLIDLNDVAIYISGTRVFSDIEWALIDIFCMKIVLLYNNFEFVEQSRLDQNVEIALLLGVTARASYLTVSHAANRSKLSRAITIQIVEDLATPVDSSLPALIERAAMFADVGNYSLPASILEKKTRLTPAEFLLVRGHAEAGACMLQRILGDVSGGYVAGLALEVMRSHHECFDGSGYPHGLAGLYIPLTARIVAVADNYMALTTARPWRNAFSHEEAVDMIRQEAGKKFDPMVVDAFAVIASSFENAPAAV